MAAPNASSQYASASKCIYSQFQQTAPSRTINSDSYPFFQDHLQQKATLLSRPPHRRLIQWNYSHNLRKTGPTFYTYPHCNEMINTQPLSMNQRSLAYHTTPVLKNMMNSVHYMTVIHSFQDHLN